MNPKRLLPALALVATGTTASGLALTALPAFAAPATPAAASVHKTHGSRLSTTKLQQVRDRQQRMLGTGATAPAFAKTGSKTFTVNTTQDSDLANPTGTACVDVATGKCSLRAAVDAANNLAKPVKIVLGKHIYTLSSGTQLTVTNPAGTSIVGAGPGQTSIKGDGSRVLYETQAAAGGADPLLFLSDLKITGGTTDLGGGVYLDYNSFGATLVLDGVAITGNTATSSGGGIYADDYGTIYANASKITNNVSPSGAGLYTYWANINLTGVDITGNHTAPGTSGSGAGWFNEYGVNRMKGGSISGNTAGDATNSGYGAGMYDEYGNTAFTKVHIDDNTANDAGEGGALYTYFDLLQMTGGTMSHNRASGQFSEGGGLYVEDGAQTDLHGVTMAGNKVTTTDGDGYGGGTIYLYANEYGNQLNITGSTISGSNGSAIYAYAYEGHADVSITGSRLTGNTTTSANGFSGYGCGGAVCAYSYEYGAVNLSMSGNKLSGNTSTSTSDYGSGAVSLYAYSYSSVTANLRSNLFENNASGISGLGGALGVYSDNDYSPISVRSQSNRFVGNKAGTAAAPGYGGAIGVYYYTTLTDQGSTFSKNRAVGDGAYGGAIYSNSFQSSRFTGTTFTGNSVGPATGGSGSGGAVYVDDEGGTTFSKVTMAGNTAASFGGGLYSDSEAYSIAVEQSTISGNVAGNSASAGYGGGIYVADAVLSVENSTIADNRARGNGQGGGIYTQGSTFGARYTTVSGNIAKQGGGIYEDGPGGTLLASIVTGNHQAPGGAKQDCSVGSVVSKLHSLGGNVLGQQSCVTATRAGDKVTSHAGLGKLRNNGGPTKTMALSKKSPAIGRARFQVPSTDQRGHGRPAHHADAGAFERPKVKHHR